MKKLQTEFIKKINEVSEEKYYEMLECLPPERQASNAFLVGEPYDHGKDQSGRFAARYELYFKEDGRFYCGGLASTNDFDTFLIPNP